NPVRDRTNDRPRNKDCMVDTHVVKEPLSTHSPFPFPQVECHSRGIERDCRNSPGSQSPAAYPLPSGFPKTLTAPDLRSAIRASSPVCGRLLSEQPARPRSSGSASVPEPPP